MESNDEPWFEDARVKTAVTIMQRCSDVDKRDSTLVRFVRFKQPLSRILGERRRTAETAGGRASSRPGAEDEQ